MSKLSWSKMTKYQLLKRNRKLVKHLPETRRMKKHGLMQMLDKYDKVIIKPSSSFGGKGVMRITAERKGRYSLHSGKKVKHFGSANGLKAYLKRKHLRGYIVQRYVSLAKANGRPFDLRVMVQRRKKSDWTVTGKLAKIAGKGYIVTNIRRSHGNVVSVKTAISQSRIRSKYSNALMSKIDKVALRTAKHLHKYYKWIRTTGVDMGLDRKGNIWIIEANFDPATSLFLKLKDKSMYRKIISYNKRK